MNAMPEMIELDRIQPNPWQPRQSEDPDHVAKIAESILRDGLLQPPVGRLVCAGEVQLAFGHTRLAAYKLINAIWQALDDPAAWSGEYGELYIWGLVSNKLQLKGDNETMLRLVTTIRGLMADGAARYDCMPVIIRELSNDEMFRQGVSENIARRDLTPLEEARAMKRYQEEFGKSSKEIGALFGIGDSAVRNKVRLLQLPEDLQTQLGAVRELVLRELVFLFDLPEDVRKRSENTWPEDYRASKILRAALDGAQADAIHNRINQMLSQYAKLLAQAPWKWDQDIEGETIRGKCKGCPMKITRDKVDHCLDTKCYVAKENAVRLAYLQAASAACGIPVHDKHEELDSYTSGVLNDKVLTEVAINAKCTNLRLIYGRNPSRFDAHVEGYDRALIMCKKGDGFCTCRQGLKAASKTTQPAEQAQSISQEDLAEAAKAARGQKRQKVAEIRAMHEDVGRAMADGLAIGNPGILWRILRHLDWSKADKYKEGLKDWGDPRSQEYHQHTIELRRLIGMELAERAYPIDVEYREPEPKHAVKALNELLNDAGFVPLPEWLHDEKPLPVSVETPHHNIRTLAEVFAAQEA